MRIQSVNSNINPNFQASLRLNNANKWNSEIANTILSHTKLQKLASESDKDIIAYQSTKIANNSRGMHNHGETLYRISLAKDTNSFLTRVLRFFGYKKTFLSRRYHSQSTTINDIIPNISYSKLKSEF